ncbi:hypothetical protein A2851_02635 [Candidatus Kaiserbacteria bacterium RIFCSPHIGHO2_01_FULL_53_29]|uniref:Uncharacterized protein n=1 Tax=Candidatus Kaiserbacteria bacterium RIFCSPHIGHO2_01_FULL_53_29 TaxID=1798480 RepID=A0A1F6CXC4_9BACT|nr:MAG: hypothetical protein A2851_02635 [Candidatus Kaiserbacteria bacterium RIFCSPHIGHO2_01_FULL_53_29]
MEKITSEGERSSQGSSMPFVGSVRKVSGQIVVVECEDAYRPQLQECLTARDDASVRLEAYAYSDGRMLSCLLLSASDALPRNTKIVSTGRRITVPVGRGILGRAMNLYGEPVDGRGPIHAEGERSIYPEANIARVRELARPGKVLETGIKTIDFFAPLQKGAKMALVGGAGVGKTIIQTEILRNIIQSNKGVSIFAGIGERIREGHALWHILEQQKVLERTALMFGYVNKNAAVRFRTAASAAALAEYFRDECGEDVLFFVDNVFRFLQAGSELSTILGEIPSQSGYQPTLQTEIAQFENRLATTRKASVTSVQTIYVPADEFANPAVTAAIAHMDAVIILSRDFTQRGWHPAIDPFRSMSDAINPQIIGEDHYQTVIEAMGVLNQYDRLARVVSVVGEEELSAQNQQTYQRAERILHYMTQPLYATELEAGRGGVTVRLADVVRDVQAILRGDLDSVSPEKLLFIGDLKSAGLL